MQFLYFPVSILCKRNGMDRKAKCPNWITNWNGRKKARKKICVPIRPFWQNKRPKKSGTKIQKECEKPKPFCLVWALKKENFDNFNDKRKRSNNFTENFYFLFAYYFFIINKPESNTDFSKLEIPNLKWYFSLFSYL